MIFADLVIRQTPREVRETSSQERISKQNAFVVWEVRGTLTCVNPSKVGLGSEGYGRSSKQHAEAKI